MAFITTLCYILTGPSLGLWSRVLWDLGDLGCRLGPESRNWKAFHVTWPLREGVKKLFVMDQDGGGGINPLAWTKIFFLEKDVECSETEKYAKIFCGIFARVSIKSLDIFPDILRKYWKYFSFRSFFSIINFFLDHSGSMICKSKNVKKNTVTNRFFVTSSLREGKRSYPPNQNLI